MTIILATLGVFLVGYIGFEVGAFFTSLRWARRYDEIQKRVNEFVCLLDDELTVLPETNGRAGDRRAVVKLVKGKRSSENS